MRDNLYCVLRLSKLMARGRGLGIGGAGGTGQQGHTDPISGAKCLTGGNGGSGANGKPGGKGGDGGTGGTGGMAMRVSSVPARCVTGRLAQRNRETTQRSVDKSRSDSEGFILVPPQVIYSVLYCTVY